MDQLPARIGPYVVDRVLGRGGMGVVYSGESEVGELVAVKVIRADRVDPDVRRRFEREAEIARTVIGTTQVARFLDADPLADQPWLAMEFVPGLTLRTCVDTLGPLPAPLVAMLGASLAHGLAKVHEVGLLHRDIKPLNIIMSERGPVLIDFGLGALIDRATERTSRGRMIGTVLCMAPEQTLGSEEITHKTDIYGLGVVLLFAATGRLPYAEGPELVVLNRIADPRALPDLTGLPGSLESLVRGLLMHDPADRPELAEVMATAFRLLDAAGVTRQEARQMLIRQTYRDEPEIPRHTPSFQERLNRLAEAFDNANGEPGPLDKEVEVNGVAQTERPEREAETEPEPAMSGGKRRTPAARRVADNLRARYGPQLRLWSSTRGRWS